MSYEQLRVLSDLQGHVDDCKFNDWRFLVRDDNGRPYLQIEFDAPCAVTKKVEPQRGRKWFLSPHMTRSEVVQTAFKAAISAMEHEVREQFLFQGRPIFGPHFNVNKLWELCEQPGAEDVRG